MWCHKYLFALLFLTFCAPSQAQTVTLTVSQLDCARGLSKEEENQVTSRWLGEDSLEVVAYSSETAESRIDANSAWVRVEGELMRLSYYHRQIELTAGEPILACLFPAKLVFVVSGLRRARYHIWVTNGHSRQIDVDG